MLFHDSNDESAWGLALVGLLVVGMAAFLGTVTGKVQPTAPVTMSHPDVSSPDLHGHVGPDESNSVASPYPSVMSPAAHETK